MTLEEIRDASNVAFAKISHDPDRLHELSYADLNALARHVAFARPITEAALIAKCGGVDEANEALRQVMTTPQPQLIKKVRLAKLALQHGREPSVDQQAAMVADLLAGWGAIDVECARRRAAMAARVN